MLNIKKLKPTSRTAEPNFVLVLFLFVGSLPTKGNRISTMGISNAANAANDCWCLQKSIYLWKIN